MRPSRSIPTPTGTPCTIEMADEAVAIGPPPARRELPADRQDRRSLSGDRRGGGPSGYGFLSEREAFPIALERAGIAFIGPNPKAIAAMGDKIESKKAAAKAKVSTVPGHLGLIEDERQAVRIARESAFPVMIKASAGGGGKGMRIAPFERRGCRGLLRARARKQNPRSATTACSFEKFIVDPRHVEIQVLSAISTAIVIYLGERECSIQRRNQKVLEEAPSPLLDEATRARMGEQAVALAKAVGYN